MTELPFLKLEVPTPELLAALASGPLPLGLKAPPPRKRFHRDLYFDTAERSLRRRGITCRFRHHADGRRELRVSMRVPEAGGLLVRWLDSAALIPELKPADALRGGSEPARRLSAFVDPDRLERAVELETERWVRRTRGGWLRIPRQEFVYDLVVIPRRDQSVGFQEMKIRRLRGGGPPLRELAAAFAEQYGVVPVASFKAERAEAMLRGAAISPGRAGLDRGERRVALIATVGDQVALVSAGGALRLPQGSGTGEAVCRTVMAASLGTAEGELRLLGTTVRRDTDERFEVWRWQAAPGVTIPAESNLEWWPFPQLVARAGAPALRDGGTLAAVAFAAQEQIAAGPPKRSPAAAGDRGLRASAVPSAPAIADGGHYLNASLSALAFNERVLALAEDPTTPLLERVRYLAIFSSNLDEFLMIQVAALKRDLARGETTRSPDGLTPQEQLDAIHARLVPLLHRQQDCLRHSCLPALEAAGVRIVSWADLDAAARSYANGFFDQRVFPLLTPRAITVAPGHPFPHLANLSMSLAVMVRDPRRGGTRFGAVTIPDRIPRFVQLPDSHQFLPIEELIRARLDAVYPGRELAAVHPFRVTRSGDLELEELGPGSLLDAVERKLQHQPFASVVRLEVDRGMPAEARNLLLRELRLIDTGDVGGDLDVHEVDGLLNLAALRELADLPLAEHRYRPVSPRSPLQPDRSIFERVTERDVLVHHPYDGFAQTVQRLLVDAAADPAVEAIRLSLYRTEQDSALVDALIRAAQAGKQVTVFVEVKARGDEERNVEWARRLEHAGIHVVYGIVQLKTHAKIALVARREGERIVRYGHIGTGNYNAATARAYTDLGLLTTDQELVADLNDLFNELVGASEPPRLQYRRLLVAPRFLLARLIGLIEREAEHATAGRGGHLRAKLNGVSDPEVIEALYRASQAGVRIELIVRGICTVRPQVPGLSDHVRVISILGRFLEHARILYFGNGGEAEYYIGSADWRPRNLRRRVEVLAPVLDHQARQRLRDILDVEWADPTAWVLESDGSYRKRHKNGALTDKGAQEIFVERAAAG